METPLLEERIDPTDDVAVFLMPDHIAITVKGGEIVVRPASHAEAQKLSIALRRAQRRVEAIGVNLARRAGR